MEDIPTAKTWTRSLRRAEWGLWDSPLTLLPPPLSLLHPSPMPTFQFSGNGNILLRTCTNTLSFLVCTGPSSGAVWGRGALSGQIMSAVRQALISLGRRPGLSWMVCETHVGFLLFLESMGDGPRGLGWWRSQQRGECKMRVATFHTKNLSLTPTWHSSLTWACTGAPWLFIF